ncbi:MAG: pyridoxal-phosphate dependent enzyme [Oligoflexales bacterium]
MKTNLILRTPLLRLSHNSGGKVFLKPENLQPFGSYKLRGVLSAVEAASREQIQAGLYAASAGNMAQSVAFAAQSLNVKCEIFVPDTAPEIKKAAIRRLGARVVELPFDKVWEMVRVKSFDTIPNGLFIHPAFTPGLREGYGAIAAEILEERPSIDAVVVPFGVGGLTLGIGEALKRLKPDVELYACEPETAAPLAASMAHGKPMRIERIPSFVDAIGTPEVLPEVFEKVHKMVKASLVVSLEEVRQAIGLLAYQQKLICEGAAGAALAASLKLMREYPEKEIACILTGGNLALDVLYDCFTSSP